MPYCANCGSEVKSKFCTVCGKPLSKKQIQKARNNFREQSPPPVAAPPPTQQPPEQDDYDRDSGPQQDEYDRDQRPQRNDHDSDRKPEQEEYDSDRRSEQEDYDSDRKPERDDYDRDRRSERDDYDRDRRSERDDYDRDRRPERDEYDHDRGETPERSSYEESTQAPTPPPTQPPVQAPKPKPRVGGAIFGVIFLFLLLMLLGVMPRPYILFEEDDPTFGKDFTLFGGSGSGGDTGNGIPSDLIGVWRTSGATLTFTSSGSGNLQMDDGFYMGFTYRVVDKAKIYFTYSGGTEEEDYSKILTLTSTTLTLQATDVSEGNYMGATTTYTKQ
jgi:hypothetical protein